MLTSSGVIAELQQCILCAEKRSRYQNTVKLLRDFWKIVQTEMSRLRFEEDTCHLVDMTTEILIELGPVDTSIIELAKSNKWSNKLVTVLASDFYVYNRCQSEQISVEWAEDKIRQFCESS